MFWNDGRYVLYKARKRSRIRLDIHPRWDRVPSRQEERFLDNGSDPGLWRRTTRQRIQMDIPTSNRWVWLRHELFVLTPFQLASLHVVLQMLDMLTTLYLVDKLGLDVEFNPVMRWLMAGGYPSFIAAKIAGACMLATVIPFSLRRSPGYAWVWRWLAILYFAVVLNNLLNVATVYILS